jgi:hypothetical protein
MAAEQEPQPTQRTQKTQPKKGEPIDIPVPKREVFDKLVRRASKGSRKPRATRQGKR